LGAEGLLWHRMNPTPDIHNPENGDHAEPERDSRILPTSELEVVEWHGDFPPQIFRDIAKDD
jgi:hypothetical protein